ncbi:hypothetical protein D3C72_1714260 [compost metagenome]
MMRAGRHARRVIERDDQAGQRAQLAHVLAQVLVAGHFRQLAVELARQPDDGAPVVAVARLRFFARGVAQRAQALRPDRAGQVAHQRGLQQAARVQHLACFGHARAGDEGAAVGVHRQHAFMRQLGEGQPHLGAAHAEHAAQLFLDQLGARRQPVLPDRGQDAVGDFLHRCTARAVRIVFVGVAQGGRGRLVGFGSWHGGSARVGRKKRHSVPSLYGGLPSSV